MDYLLDTNIISELRKGDRTNPGVRQWFESLGDERIFLSALTVGELRRGIESLGRRDPASAASLDAWLHQILALHADRILPVDREAAEEWGRLGLPHRIPVIDGLLAATAKVRGMTLVTRNVRDITATGVDHVDPFAVG